MDHEPGTEMPDRARQRAAARRWVWVHGGLLGLAAAAAVVTGAAGRFVRFGTTIPEILFVLFVVSPFLWGLIRALVELKKPVRKYGYSGVPLLVFLVYPIAALNGISDFFIAIAGLITAVFFVDAIRGLRYLFGIATDWETILWDR
jgi:hypothetical protein